MKIAGFGLAFLLVLPAGLALAQDQSAPPDQVSPAEAARRAREEKQAQPKATKTFDNDNLPNKPGAINVVGEAPATSDDAGAGAAPGAAQGSAAGGGADTSAAKAKVESLKAELESQKRKYDLDSQMYYGKPDYSTDKSGQQRLDDEQAQINAKQQEIEEAQRQLDAAETQAKSAGGASDETNKQTPSPTPN